MKKLLLSLVLVLSSIVMFAQNENQVEPTKTSTLSIVGDMERDGKNLVIAGRELTNDELKAILSADAYETYMSAKVQYSRGKGFLTAGWITAGAALGLAVAAGVTGSDAINVAARLCAIPADVFLPLGFVFKGIGKGRINWVAEDYNRNQNKNYSFNVAPSVMKCNAPSAENNLALGMTFSLNF